MYCISRICKGAVQMKYYNINGLFSLVASWEKYQKKMQEDLERSRKILQRKGTTVAAPAHRNFTLRYTYPDQ
jgi:hypothetical protein